MGHKFDPKKAELLDSEERRKFFPPEPLIELALKQNIERKIVFDIGAGTGYFTIPLARIFEKVYAVESSLEMSKLLKEKLEKNGIKNVGVIVSEEPPEIDFNVNLVMFSNVIHEMDDPARYIEWAKSADCIVIADWKTEVDKSKGLMGPPLSERIPTEKILEILRKINENFEVKVIDDLYPYHYVIIVKKST